MKNLLGTTDRIDLLSFYPLLACIAQICHMHPDVPHPGLDHKILNSANPMDIVEFPNGTCAKLVLLGDKINFMNQSEEGWWPTAVSPQVRSKLHRRIVNEGFILPIVLATCIAMVSEIYSTTAVSPRSPPENSEQFTGLRRIRLCHNRLPIADFGVAKGSARVTSQDRIAYYNVDENWFMMGQDPLDHYWIYFITVSGEEYFLDCGMLTFNLGMMVKVDPYCKHGLPPLSFVPAYFYGEENRRLMPITELTGWKPKERFSILRNSEIPIEMPGSTEYSTQETKVICSLMDRIAGRTCTALEKKLLMNFIPNATMILVLNIKDREYVNFPKEPQLALDKEPGDLDDLPDSEDKAYEKYLKKWSRRYKRGKVTPEGLNRAFRAWLDNPHEARMKMAGVDH